MRGKSTNLRYRVSSELKKLNSSLIESALPFQLGEIYNASKIKDSIKEIRDLAEISGYSFIEINPVVKKILMRKLLK